MVEPENIAASIQKEGAFLSKSQAQTKNAITYEETKNMYLISLSNRKTLAIVIHIIG